MVDYSSWKVTDLKAELKKRGIPQTGLRLKQHFIDKLAEEDAKGSTDDAAAAAAAETAPTESSPADNVPEVTAEAPASSEAPIQQQPEEQQHLAQSHEQPPQQEHPITKEKSPPTESPQKESPEKKEEKEQDTEKEESTAHDIEAQSKAGEQSSEDVKPAEETAPEPVAPSDETITLKPAEQDGGDIGKENQEELAQPFDRSVPSVPQTSEANTELSTPLPIEEALEDKRKRKRRSQSPVPTPEAIAAKKARAMEEGGPHVVQEDKEPSIGEGTGMSPEEQRAKESSLPTSAPKPPTPVKQDARFRGLFASADSAPVRPPSPSQDVEMQDANVEPAKHAATSSLYIDGLMRPLQPLALKKHLASLASAPGAQASPEVIQEYYLDPIKTHCFVRFSDVQAASRVRSSVHGKVWPNERNRKNLLADFIPDEKIQEWIQREEASRDRAGAPARWEVRYETTEDGTTTASLSEAGLNLRSAPTQTHQLPTGSEAPPLGPRGSLSQADRQRPSAPPAGPPRPGHGFKPLDELFKSTTAKPKLYYMPVARGVADKRLDQFDELLRKGAFPRRGGDEMRRITFEEDDEFVDIGPEYGRAAAQRRQERGGRGGGRAAGGGEGGKNWRGR